MYINIKAVYNKYTMSNNGPLTSTEKMPSETNRAEFYAEPISLNDLIKQNFTSKSLGYFLVQVQRSLLLIVH